MNFCHSFVPPERVVFCMPAAYNHTPNGLNIPEDFLQLISSVLLLGLSAAAAPNLRASPAPAAWLPRGPGGGGALYSPAISPHQPNQFYIACDMSELFHSNDAGRSWEALSFRQIQGGNRTAPVQFTSDPAILYALDFGASDGNAVAPKKSMDGGRTSTYLPQDPTESEAYSLYADPNSTQRLLISNYDTIFFSNNGGASFQAVFTVNDCHVAGAFFDGDEIFVGTRAGLLVSSNGGGSFSLASYSGLPVDEAVVSFAGAKQNGARRFFCVTMGQDDVWPAMTGAEHWGYRGIYRLDEAPNAAWSRTVAGIGSDDHPFFVGLTQDRIDIAYAHDPNEQTWYVSVSSGWGGPPNGLGGLYRTTNRGAAWTRINALNRVRSCTIHPADPNHAYMSTEEDGLWFTSNLTSAQPAFSEVSGYPFKNPLRVFFNPYDASEVWVTSFGNGLRVARMETEALRFSAARLENGRFQALIQAATGQEVIVSASTDLKTWSDVWANTVNQGVLLFEEPEADVRPGLFYRARSRAGLPLGTLLPLEK
jgi:hypothetical protein